MIIERDYSIKQITDEKVLDLLHNGVYGNYIYKIYSKKDNCQINVLIGSDLYTKFNICWGNMTIFAKGMYKNQIKEFIVEKLQNMY